MGGLSTRSGGSCSSPSLELRPVRYAWDSLFANSSSPTVQRILKHTSITVTRSTYIDVIEQVQHDALRGLDVLFDDESTG